MHNISDNTSVLLIYTGGTIGMIENPETGALENFNLEQLQKQIPELHKFSFHIDTYQFDPPMDSSDIDPDIWRKLVHIISEHYDNYSGFIILHGTDTMAYTASALSFMLEGLSKPVILTGSQLPIGVLRTDGKENLLTYLYLHNFVNSTKDDLNDDFKCNLRKKLEKEFSDFDNDVLKICDLFFDAYVKVSSCYTMEEVDLVLSELKNQISLIAKEEK